MTTKRLFAPAAACAALFAALAVAVSVRWAPLLRLDDSGVQGAYDLTTKSYRHLLKDWGSIVAPANLMYAGVALAVYLLVRRRVRQAVVTAVAAVGGNYLVEGLKTAFGRPRPNLQHTLARSTGFSFPSHHALMATLLGGLVVLALPTLRTRFVVIAAALALFTAYSRVALGVHFPSDVVAGCALGFVLVTAAAVAARPLRPSPVAIA